MMKIKDLINEKIFPHFEAHNISQMKCAKIRAKTINNIKQIQYLKI